VKKLRKSAPPPPAHGFCANSPTRISRWAGDRLIERALALQDATPRPFATPLSATSQGTPALIRASDIRELFFPPHAAEHHRRCSLRVHWFH
jgi:hypothetical protein